MKDAKVDTKTKIMDVAEELIIHRGYGGFSFRDIAKSVDIKSASVHYHFPTKGDLVAAVMARFTVRFCQRLPVVDGEINAESLLKGFISGFKSTIVEQGNMSICTVLTSDKPILPEQVCAELANFYESLLVWLTQVFLHLESNDGEDCKSQASQLLASLHGASILVQGTNNPDHFDRVIAPWMTKRVI